MSVTINPEKKTVRQEIVSAIEDGGSGIIKTDVQDDKTLIYVELCNQPIKVLPDDVILPDALKGWGPGIRLDVQTILALASDWKLVDERTGRIYGEEDSD